MKYFIVILMLAGSLYAEVKKEYYENKQLKSETSYKDGLKHGEENLYREDGRIYSSTLYKHGEKHGIDKDYWYFDNRRVIYEDKYKNGKKLPGSKTFEEEDNKERYLSNEILYIDGKKIEEEYYSNGNIKAIIHYRDEEVKETEEEYYKNGNLKRKVVYGDKEEGPYAIQKILSEIEYQNIKKIGSRGKRNALLYYKEAVRISRSKENYTDQNQKLIAENYEKACDLNHAESCTALAKKLDYYRVFGSLRKSYLTSLHRKACDLGSGEGCFWLAWSYWHLRDDEDKDMPKVIKYYKKSCDLGHYSGCANLANTYLVGKDVPADGFKSNKYFKKACELSHNSHSCEMSKILTDKGYY